MSDVLSLSGLPLDIIRSIVKMDIEAIDETRLISHRWLDVVGSLLSDRKQLPMITSFSFECRGDSRLHVFVYTRPTYAKYFGIEQWKCTEHGRNADFNNDFCILSMRTELKVSLAKLFTRCSCVGTFVLSMEEYKIFIMVKNTLRDVIVNELRVVNLKRFDLEISESVQNFIRIHFVKRARLDFKGLSQTKWDTIKPNLVNFLHKMIALNVSIELRFAKSLNEMGGFLTRNCWQQRLNAMNEEGNLSAMIMMEDNGIIVIHVGPA